MSRVTRHHSLVNNGNHYTAENPRVLDPQIQPLGFENNKQKNFDNDYRFLWKIIETHGEEPPLRWGHTGVYIPSKKKIFYFGGWDGNVMLDDCYFFDLAKQAWEKFQTKGTKPSARAGHSATIIDGDIIIIYGGGDGQQYFNELYVFNPCADGNEQPQWTQTKATSQTRVYINESILNGDEKVIDLQEKLFVESPRNSPLPSITQQQQMTFQKSPSLIPNNSNNKEHDGKMVRYLLPLPRSRHAAVLHESHIYIFGGGNASKNYNDMWTLDTQKLEWNRLKVFGDIPPPRWGHTLSVYNAKLYVFGGTFENKMLNDLFEFDPKTCQYKQIVFPANSAIPSPRAAHTTTIVNDFMVILWGGDNNRFLPELFVVSLKTFYGRRFKVKTPKARCAHTSTWVGLENHNNNVNTVGASGGLLYIFGGGGDGSTEGGFMIKDLKNLYTLDIQSLLLKQQFEVLNNASYVLSQTSSSSPSFSSISSAGSVLSSNNNASMNNNSPTHNSSLAISSSERTTKEQLRTIESKKSSINKDVRQRSEFARRLQIYSETDAKEMANWLVSLGLGRYSGNFIDEEIDLKCLPFLTEIDLINIGVTKVGPRKKILAAVAEELTMKIPPPPPPLPKAWEAVVADGNRTSSASSSSSSLSYLLNNNNNNNNNSNSNSNSNCSSNLINKGRNLLRYADEQPYSLAMEVGNLAKSINEFKENFKSFTKDLGKVLTQMSNNVVTSSSSINNNNNNQQPTNNNNNNNKQATFLSSSSSSVGFTTINTSRSDVNISSSSSAAAAGLLSATQQQQQILASTDDESGFPIMQNIGIHPNSLKHQLHPSAVRKKGSSSSSSSPLGNNNRQSSSTANSTSR